MEKRISFIYTVLSIVFFVLVLLFSFLRIYSIRQQNIAVAEKSISSLQYSLNSTYDTDTGFDAPQFKRAAQEFLLSSPAVNIIVIFSYDTGIQYMLARKPGYLAESPASDIRFTEPQFLYNSLTEAPVSTSLSLPDKKGIILEGVFTVLDGSSFFPVIRDTLIGSGAFLLLTLLLIIVLALLRRSESKNTITDGSNRDEISPFEQHQAESGLSGTTAPSRNDDIDIHFQESVPEYRPDENNEEFMIDESDLEYSENNLDLSLEELDRLGTPDTAAPQSSSSPRSGDLKLALSAALSSIYQFYTHDRKARRSQTIR